MGKGRTVLPSGEGPGEGARGWGGIPDLLAVQLLPGGPPGGDRTPSAGTSRRESNGPRRSLLPRGDSVQKLLLPSSLDGPTGGTFGFRKPKGLFPGAFTVFPWLRKRKEKLAKTMAPGRACGRKGGHRKPGFFPGRGVTPLGLARLAKKGTAGVEVYPAERTKRPGTPQRASGGERPFPGNPRLRRAITGPRNPERGGHPGPI